MAVQALGTVLRVASNATKMRQLLLAALAAQKAGQAMNSVQFPGNNVLPDPNQLQGTFEDSILAGPNLEALKGSLTRLLPNDLNQNVNRLTEIPGFARDGSQLLGTETPLELPEAVRPDSVVRMFGGQGAEGFDEAEGKFSGLADKQERFEIDDSVAGLQGKVRKEFEDAMPNVETSVFETLGGVLDHPELFNRYPELKDVDVRIDILKKKSNLPDHLQADADRGDAKGSFTPFVDRSGEGLFDIQPEIKITARSKEAAMSTLLHEIQHAIQEKEGFARGGSPAEFSGDVDLSDLPVDTRQEIEEIDAKAEENDKTIAEFDAFFKSLPNEAKGVGKLVNESREYEKALALRKNLRQSKSITLSSYRSKANFNNYQRLSGEVEARDVQARQGLTAEERQSTQPFASQGIPLAQQILKGMGGKSLSTGDLGEQAKSFDTAEEFVGGEVSMPLSNLDPMVSRDIIEKTPSKSKGAIEVIVEKDGSVTVVDGLHRYFEALDRGDSTIKVKFDVNNPKTTQRLTDIFNKAKGQVTEFDLSNLPKTGENIKLNAVRGETGIKTDEGDYGQGLYLTGDIQRAKAFARGPIDEPDRRGKVASKSVELKNPKVFKTVGEAREFRRSVVGDELLDKPQSKEASRLMQESLKEFDGVIVFDSMGQNTAEPSKPFEVVVFNKAKGGGQ